MAEALGFSIPLVLVFFLIDIGFRRISSVPTRICIAIVVQSLLAVGLVWNQVDMGAELSGALILNYGLVFVISVVLSIILVLLRRKKKEKNPK